MNGAQKTPPAARAAARGGGQAAQKGKEAYLLEAQALGGEELALAVFLQGAVNRGGKTLCLDADGYADYLFAPLPRIGLEEALDRFAPQLRAVAVFDYAAGDVSVNMAATVCAAEGWLGVPRSLLPRVQKYGLPIAFDAACVRGTDAERQRAVWLRCRAKLRRNCLVHQVTDGAAYRPHLRDDAIARGAFCFYAKCGRDDAFLAEVLGWAQRCIPVYGWTDNELAFVKQLSAFGDRLIPCDWSLNHSFFRAAAQPPRQRCRAERLRADPRKHYLAVVVSDGDNVQWWERGFCRGGLFGQRTAGAYPYKMSWTAPPSLARLCPPALAKAYAAARRDTFVCGVSGAGYTNCMTYPERLLPRYARETAQAMKRADLHVLALLDNIAFTGGGNAERRLAAFAAQPQIEGGIWQLDPDRYESGKGKIFWAGGKPFVSVGVSLWHPSCDPACVTEKWLDGVVRTLNARRADIGSEAGYTVLNVHPWTMDMHAVDHVLSRLGAHIEIVYAEELIALVRENVPAKE